MIRGCAIVVGDDVNTDLLHPSYFFSLDPETVRKGFMGAVTSVDARDEDKSRVIVAGRNFGCGSSRETTMTALKLAGVRGVVAESFGRIFFRNAMSLGMTARTVPSLKGFATAGDSLCISGNELHNERTGAALPLDPLDPFWEAVLMAGGLIPFLTSRGDL